MNQLQVFILGLILLLPGAVDSYKVVQGLVGHPVTLPCNYSTHHEGSVPSCWGLGKCRHSYCIRTLLWTNGHKVTFQRSNQYQLKGNISEGNVSLTIEKTVVSDGGPYCCIVEIPGAFYFVDYLLEVKSEVPTRPTTTGRPTTNSTISTHVPTPTRVSTSTPSKPAHTQTHKPDWNNTVTSSGDSWNNNTLGHFPVSKIGASQKEVVKQARGEDKVYIMEDSPYPEEESQWPSEVPSA